MRRALGVGLLTALLLSGIVVAQEEPVGLPTREVAGPVGLAKQVWSNDIHEMQALDQWETVLETTITKKARGPIFVIADAGLFYEAGRMVTRLLIDGRVAKNGPGESESMFSVGHALTGVHRLTLQVMETETGPGPGGYVSKPEMFIHYN